MNAARVFVVVVTVESVEFNKVKKRGSASCNLRSRKRRFRKVAERPLFPAFHSDSFEFALVPPLVNHLRITAISTLPIITNVGHLPLNLLIIPYETSATYGGWHRPNKCVDRRLTPHSSFSLVGDARHASDGRSAPIALNRCAGHAGRPENPGWPVRLFRYAAGRKSASGMALHPVSHRSKLHTVFRQHRRGEIEMPPHNPGLSRANCVVVRQQLEHERL